jgi:thiol-disulfide isomerase/thioredoxin
MPNYDLTIACLCAQWCGSCRSYQATFEEVRSRFPGHRFVWLDIEDADEVPAALDVEKFPTMLVARGETPLFFGVLLPHASHLSRLIESLEEGEPAPLTAGDDEAIVVDLARRIDRAPAS